MDVGIETLPSHPHRVPELWFEDGNIVIQAGNSQFRLFRSILAARSPVFQDMFSFPQPLDSEMIDGCPLVRLHDLEAEAIVFFKAIFDPEFFMPFPAQTEFDTVAGCLRLAHKYGVDYLCRRALVHLSSAYDTTLSRWDVSQSQEPRSVLEKVSFPWFYVGFQDLYALQLFREVDALWLLPNAFYNLSVDFNRLGMAIFHGSVYKGIPTAISEQDQRNFIKGHSIQTQTTATDSLRFLSYPLDIDGCESPLPCRALRLDTIDDLGRELIRASPFDALDVWTLDDWENLGDLCDTCLRVLKDTHQSARQKFWDELPQIYGLPPWEELERVKLAALGSDSLC
ncbi:hypothetical protein C8R43DRAFT_1016403 [Mycena crocata]|nr:hypothetical protein C8R43DRAFT_1016403 [Mycena crocata]